MLENNMEGQAMAEIGKNIAKLRKLNNLTQEQLAEKVGVSPQAVSKWENGLSCPDITLLPTIAKLFGITVDELLGDEIDTEKISKPQINYEKKSKSNEGGKITRQLIITVTKPDGKETNIKLPSVLFNFGIKLGGDLGGISSEQAGLIKDAVENGLTGEILRVNGENGEIIVIKIE